MKENETINVHDSKDFHYEVEVQHRPQLGFSTAYYKGRIIGQCELGKLSLPISDDDREWEMYEEKFSEWRDEILINLICTCKRHFENGQN